MRITEAWYADLPLDGADDAIAAMDFTPKAEAATPAGSGKGRVSVGSRSGVL